MYQYQYNIEFNRVMCSLDRIVMFTFLEPYLRDQKSFNENHTSISKVLGQFLLEFHTPEVSSLILTTKSKDFVLPLCPPQIHHPEVTRKLLLAMRHKKQGDKLSTEENRLLNWAMVHLKHYMFIMQICTNKQSYEALLYILGINKNTYQTVANLHTHLALYASNANIWAATDPALNISSLLAKTRKTLPDYFLDHYATLNLAHGYPANTSAKARCENTQAFLGAVLLGPTGAIFLASLFGAIPSFIYGVYPTLYADLGLSTSFMDIYLGTLFMATCLFTVALVTALIISTSMIDDYRYKREYSLLPEIRKDIEEYTQSQVKIMNDKCELMTAQPSHSQATNMFSYEGVASDAPPPGMDSTTSSYHKQYEKPKVLNKVLNNVQ